MHDTSRIDKGEVEGVQITLTSGDCPFPSNFFDVSHPGTSSVSSNLFRLLRELGGGVWETARGVNLVEYVGRLYPQCTPEGLELLSIYSIVLFVHDDWVIERNSNGQFRESKELASLYRLSAEVLGGLRAPSDAPAFVRLVEPLSARLHALCDLLTVERFKRYFDEFLRAHVWEIENLRNGLIPTLPTYPAMRRGIGGVDPAFALHPVVWGLSIDAEVLDHPCVRKAREMINNLISWTNDIFSLKKELREGSNSNLVIVIRDDRGFSWQESMDWVVSAIRKETQAYCRLASQLRAMSVCEGNRFSQLETLLRGEETIYANSFAWHLSPRYTEDATA